MGLLLTILLSVTLQAPFVQAEAQILGVPAARTVDVTVTVEGEPMSVAARITDGAGSTQVVALVQRGEGTFGQVVRLAEWADMEIAFEYVSAEGESTISSTSTLSALGVEIPGAAPPVTAAPESAPSRINPLMVAGIAVALGAIVLLGFWSTGGLADTLRPRSDDWTYAATAGINDDEPPARKQSPGATGDDPIDDPVESSA
jgi:hypothetical protein